MVTDLYGFIECRPWPTWPDLPEEVPWETAVDLECVYTGPSYDAFGCLFGVCNFAQFRPVAPARGLPVDTSELIRRAHDDFDVPVSGATWVLWSEILGIDWDEPAERTDSRIHAFHRDADGEWGYHHKAGYDPAFVEAAGEPPVDPRTGIAAWPPGSEWLVGDTLYRAEVLRRRDAVRADGPWQPVWDMMRILASLHGPEYVRLVVWFD